MNSPSVNSSPTYRNLKTRQKQSPIELREKLRKNYKDKIHNCRSLLMNSFRGVTDDVMRNTLTEMYQNLFNDYEHVIADEEEQNVFQEMQKEFIQEEFEWLTEEYEKSQQINGIDWSAMEDNNNVFCPVCQKSHLVLNANIISCCICKFNILIHRSLGELKKYIMNCVEKHNCQCCGTVEFTTITDTETHIYLICALCQEMQLIV